MNKFRFLPLVAAGAAFVGCNDFDYGVTPDAFKQKEYAENFEKVFGTPDPNQDWSMAAVINADIDLPSVNGACKVSVYTSRPGNADCKLVTTKTISNSSTISFDYPKNLSKVFIEVVNGNAVVISDYFTIENNNVVASTRNGATRAGLEITRVPVTKSIGTFNFQDHILNDPTLWATFVSKWNLGEYDKWNIPYIIGTNPERPTFGAFNLYQLEGYTYTVGDGDVWTMSDLAPILGYDGVFEERCTASIANGEGCARLEWRDELKPEVGIDYVMAADGPVTLHLMYGATQKHNKFGYLYYKDGASLADIVGAPHYIIMEDATPEKNIIYSNGFTSWNTIAMDMESATDTRSTNQTTDAQKEAILSRTVTGTNIPLVYYNEDGEASYTFPENTHIVFFEMIDQADAQPGTGWSQYLFYSRPDLNAFYGKYLAESQTSHVPSGYTVPSGVGTWSFITYSWGETILMGMEDTNDDDMNDLLFSVKGNFKEKPKDINPETPKNLKWLVACEDLGGTFDYDFNDIVIGFEKKTDGHLWMTPLTSGGTLPSVVSYEGKGEIGEIHQLLGAASADIYTADVTCRPGTAIDLGECEDTGIAAALEKLFIKVDNKNETVTILKSGFAESADKTPQMLLLPGGWDWPTEGTGITSVYNGFVQWAQDADYTSWIKKTGAEYVNNTWGK